MYKKFSRITMLLRNVFILVNDSSNSPIIFKQHYERMGKRILKLCFNWIHVDVHQENNNPLKISIFSMIEIFNFTA